MQPRTELAAFLTEHGITRQDAATALGVSRTVLFYWLTGKATPGLKNRRNIEVYTRGRVKSAAWELPEEQVTVKPFEPKHHEEPDTPDPDPREAIG